RSPARSSRARPTSASPTSRATRTSSPPRTSPTSSWAPRSRAASGSWPDMYILLALIAACVLGIAVRYVIPHRELRGVTVAPAISTAVAAVVYTALQWAGVGEDSVWLWLASVGGGVAVAAVAALLL